MLGNERLSVMTSQPFVRDFLSCVSCERLLMVAKPKVSRNDKKNKASSNPTFHLTVCYTCEREGAMVPPKHDPIEFDSNVTFYLNSSLVRSSINFIAAGKLVDDSLEIQERGRRVKVWHRDVILHSYEAGSRVVTVNIYEHVNSTAVECPYLEAGFF